MISINFIYITGINREMFRNLKLVGSWDSNGRFAEQWTATPLPMDRVMLEDGCPGYTATVNFNECEMGRTFSWGVRLDAPLRPDTWGITTEVHDQFSTLCHCSFVLTKDVKEQYYYFTHCRRLGAQKRFFNSKGQPRVQFAVWAPNAKKVELVIGKFQAGVANSGYISNDGTGIDITSGVEGAFQLQLQDGEGIWYTDANDTRFASFSAFDHKPYMFRVTKDDDRIAYRTDLYSRCQIGKGTTDPQGAPYTGHYKDLDGTVSCSVVIDPDTVTEHFKEEVWPEIHFISQEQFWANEYDASRPLPRRVEDLIIYELHIGSLGFGQGLPGDFADAVKFLDYLVDLGVNAVELLPVLEYEGIQQWGYGTSHPFALEFSAGGRDQLKHLIRECHRRGLAVIMDVVYNHYHKDAERAEWGYDSNAPERNIYYWYEGRQTDYPDYERAVKADAEKNPEGHGGYLDNYSTGYAPRFHEEMVRKWLISSAVALAEEFHVDGFRVDLTQALYQFNVRHGDGVPVLSANAFGAKFLREFTRTIKMIKPQCILIAEDHSNQAFVTESTDHGGLGFDATWYADFYHHLIGDGDYGANYARLLYEAGFGDDRPLAMDYFAGALAWSGQRKVVYHKDHDDAGNGKNTARTMVTAVNGAPQVGNARVYAEARCRWVCGLSMLSAGTPIFLMGEEVASINPLPFRDFLPYREDLVAERAGTGRHMFKFYQDIIRLRRNHPGFRSHMINVVYTHNANRVIAFLRTDGFERFLVVASLNNRPFSPGYRIDSNQLGEVTWREIFNSDSSIYGGSDIGNFGQVIISHDSRINVIIPSNGFVVLRQE